MHRRTFIVSVGALALVGCGESKLESTPTAAPGSATPVTATPVPQATNTATPAPSPTPTARPPVVEPTGFPIAPNTRTGRVVGEVGARTIHWGEGPTALAYSRDDQPSDDPERANACGWNARTHLEYEGQPAVDWYVPVGTPVVATMDGVATLLINTVSNPFDFYGVSREPYIGNPDRARAPISPFPGPGGGQGAFVRIENERFRTDSAHLEIGRTLDAVPADAYLPGYSAAFDFAMRVRRDPRLSHRDGGCELAGEGRRCHRLHRRLRLQRSAAPALCDPSGRRGECALSDGGTGIREQGMAVSSLTLLGVRLGVVAREHVYPEVAFRVAPDGMNVAAIFER